MQSVAFVEGEVVNPAALVASGCEDTADDLRLNLHRLLYETLLGSKTQL